VKDLALVRAVIRGETGASAEFEAKTEPIIRHCLLRARAAHPDAATATLLVDGSVLIAGGTNANGPGGSNDFPAIAELFFP
jgi:hypothetical protein